MTGPLDGLLVLDFSKLVPGPLATLMLSEAGAEVVKIERPGPGNRARTIEIIEDGHGLGFKALNCGKKSIALDLKSAGAVVALTPLIKRADILVEQFRPGVMGRLGLSYEAVKEINPGIIYCSITGYGQTGPKRARAGHDLNYIADAGLLSLSSGPVDQPTIPPALIADVGGGTYPAVINILLALRNRDQTGQGAHLDIAMSENVFVFACTAFAQTAAQNQAMRNGGELLTGGSPRYHLYPTSDKHLVAVAALEQKFWDAFCAAIDLDTELRDDKPDPQATMRAVGGILGARRAGEWRPILEACDCCCTILSEMSEAMDDPHFNARDIFGWSIEDGRGGSVPALPLPIAPEFRRPKETMKAAPELGNDNNAFDVETPGDEQS